MALFEASLLLEAAPVAIVGINRQGQILFVNGRLEELFGYQRAELLGQKIEILIPPRFWQVHRHHRHDFMAAPRTRPMGSGLNLTAIRKNGVEFPIEVGLSYTEIQGEWVVMGSITDITIRKELADILEQRVEARTREIERRRRVADSLHDTLTILNSGRSLGEILDYIVSQAVGLLDQAAACAILRWHKDDQEFVMQTGSGLAPDFMAHAPLPAGDGEFEQALLARQPAAIANVNGLKGETGRTWRATGYQALLAVPLVINDDLYGALILFYPKSRQFSKEEFELAVTFADQAALAIENARLRTQAEQTAVAAERSRLARDLHDSVTQTLFSAGVIADVLPRLWDTNPAEGQRRAKELRELTRGALAEMRTLLLELRPAKLVEIPLSDLLHQLTEAIIGRARVPITLNVIGRCHLSPDVQIALYRIAQEALNNVAKHARASQATVTLSCETSRVTLSICDDGAGFILDTIKPENLGLTIMKERAEAIKATLSITSELGQGTQVTVAWPES
jgi:PAS domain S-box-containing protein